MLPNLKILMCGAVFGLLLFAVTGAGVMLPDSYTRVGEVPEISRPMMQRMIADEPTQAQFYIMTVARRSEELERLRERTAVEIFSAPPEPDLFTPNVGEKSVADDIPVDDVEAPVRVAAATVPNGAFATTGTAANEAETEGGSVQARATESRTGAAVDDTAPAEVVALSAASTDTNSMEQTPSPPKVPLPPMRPTARTNDTHSRSLHRKPQIAQAPPQTFGQSLFLRPPLLIRQ